MSYNALMSTPIHYQTIYTKKVKQYDELVSHEDHQDNLLKTICEIIPLHRKTVVELGCGTGRLTRLLAPDAQYIHAFDISPEMVDYAKMKSEKYHNIEYGVADNRSIPLPDYHADIVVEGWSLGHIASWNEAHWQEEVDKTLAEMERLCKPQARIMIIETMGSGVLSPRAPKPILEKLYSYLEAKFFQKKIIRTDYMFESHEQAKELLDMFFGEKMKDSLLGDTLILEYTGIWYKTV